MRKGVSLALLSLAGMTLAGVWTVPGGWQAMLLLAARDEPAVLTDVKLAAPPAGEVARMLERHATEALQAGDTDLARSLLDLAGARQLSVAEPVRQAVADAEAKEAAGFVTGTGEDAASLAGTLTGDLFVYGDIRDAVREGGRLMSGEAADPFVLGLATAGLAITAGTYASGGTAAPARVGVSLVKVAYKSGRVGAGLGRWVRSAVQDVARADTSVIKTSVIKTSVIKASVPGMAAAGLTRLAKDTGRIQTSAGTRAAFDALKLADGPGDVARAAKLAEAKGSQTRAIFKTLGRGALVLGTGAASLIGWLAGALMTVLGALVSIKSMTERATQAWLDRRKVRRLKAALADAALVKATALAKAGAAR
jgi:hypothetical protein